MDYLDYIAFFCLDYHICGPDTVSFVLLWQRGASPASFFTAIRSFSYLSSVTSWCWQVLPLTREVFLASEQSQDSSNE